MSRNIHRPHSVNPSEQPDGLAVDGKPRKQDDSVDTSLDPAALASKASTPSLSPVPSILPTPPAGSSLIDLSRLRTSQAFPGFGPTKVEQGVVPCDKPKPDIFFRVNPDPNYQICCYLLKPPSKGKDSKDDGDFYYIDPDLWEPCKQARIPGMRWYRLVVWVDPHGNYGLWPLRERDGGREDSWMLSGLTVAEKCQTAWGAIRSNTNRFDWEPLKVPNPPDPVFPKDPFEKLIERAFEGRIINTWDHEKLRQMRGEML